MRDAFPLGDGITEHLEFVDSDRGDLVIEVRIQCDALHLIAFGDELWTSDSLLRAIKAWITVQVNSVAIGYLHRRDIVIDRAVDPKGIFRGVLCNVNRVFRRVEASSQASAVVVVESHDSALL